jgi:serine/threonine protein kinase/tetratricopeptide (TPR) repeat protein
MRLGEVIHDRFAVTDEVAAGGMGRIFRAHDRVEGRDVALKIVHLDVDDEHEATATGGGGHELAAERFEREVALLARLQHPGIVRYVDHGTTPRGERFLAMEWIDGIDLAAYLKQRRVGADDVNGDVNGDVGSRADTGLVTGVNTASSRRPATAAMRVRGHRAALAQAPLTRRRMLVEATTGMSLRDVLALVRRVASSLAEFHRQGIVHRDLKPANIQLPGGQLHKAKIIDFGTARAGGGDSSLTATGMIVGTPSYLAPEQARAERRLTPAVDVWALGCVAYECLVGEPPIRGRNFGDLLARIVAGEVPPVTERRPDVSEALAKFVHRLLAGDPAQRLADGSAVLEALAVVEQEMGLGGALSLAPQRGDDDVVLTAAERRVHAVLVARLDEGGPSADDVALRWSALGPVTAFAGDCAVVCVVGGRSPGDQAVVAARAALALRAAFPAIRTGLALARVDAHDDVDDDLVARVLDALDDVDDGSVVVDDDVTGLLDTRFLVAPGPHGALLTCARERDAPRTLLGRPALWVGRRRELTNLQLLLEDALEEPAARAVVVTGPAGIGKSRLKSEFLRLVETAGRSIEVLHGRGESIGAGSPFSLLGTALRHSAGILDGEPEDRRRAKLVDRVRRTLAADRALPVASLLGEMVGVSFDDDDNEALRAARRDPLLLNESMRAAWEEWIAAECARRPVVLVLDDLHWGDLPSVKYVDAALRRLDAAPFFVLALARPEVSRVFPSLWAGRRVQDLRVDALSTRAAGELVRHVLVDVDDAVVDDLVRRSAGNAFFLEELIRAARAKASTLPETVLAMVQARLDAFGVEARRVLRAASVFGEEFWAGGVSALLGGGGAFAVDEWLNELVQREVIDERRVARLPGEREFKFRHALVRDAAYAMLTVDDRVQGHRLAAHWLEDVGENDALLLGEHFQRGGESKHAVRYLARAAQQAFEGGDLQAARVRAEQALQAGADGSQRGALRALQANAAYWQSDYAAARVHGEEAIAVCAPGTRDWFSAVGTTIVACARLGDRAGLDRWFAVATGAEARNDAGAAQLIALARGTFQLVFHGRFADADRALARIVKLAAEATDVDALTRAQVHHVQGARAAYVGDVSTFLTHLQSAVEQFAAAGDIRNVALEKTTVAWCHAELGDFAEAERLCRDSLAWSEARQLQQASTYARVNLGFILTFSPGCEDEARTLLERAESECAAVGNRRLQGWACGHLSTWAHRAGDLAASAKHAAQAIDLLSTTPGLQAWALACHARAILPAGRSDAAVIAVALDEARRAVAMLESLGGLLQGESLPRVVLAAVLEATGDVDAAHEQRRLARVDLLRRADRLARPDWRARFVVIPEHAEILSVAGTASPTIAR